MNWITDPPDRLILPTILSPSSSSSRMLDYPLDVKEIKSGVWELRCRPMMLGGWEGAERSYEIIVWDQPSCVLVLCATCESSWGQRGREGSALYSEASVSSVVWGWEGGTHSRAMDGEGMWKGVSTETKIDPNLWGGYQDSKYQLPVCAGVGAGRGRCSEPHVLRVKLFKPDLQAPLSFSECCLLSLMVPQSFSFSLTSASTPSPDLNTEQICLLDRLPPASEMDSSTICEQQAECSPAGDGSRAQSWWKRVFLRGGKATCRVSSGCVLLPAQPLLLINLSES